MIAALDGPGKPAGVTVDRLRRQAVEPGELPRISVYPLDEAVTRAPPNRGSAKADRLLRIAIVSRVQGTDEALDPLRQWVAAVMASPALLAGLAVAVDEKATDWEAVEDSERDYSVAASDWEIRYVTRSNDLTQ